MSSSVITHKMDIKVISKCFIEQCSGLTVDAASNRIPTTSVIFCKKITFIITEDEDISLFAGG